MKSQSTKSRVMFESSLELKCLFFFGIAIAVVITMSFWLYWRVTETQISTQNLVTAETLGRQHLLFKHIKEFLKEKPFRRTFSEQIGIPSAQEPVFSTPLSQETTTVISSEFPSGIGSTDKESTEEDFLEVMGELMGEKLIGQKNPPETEVLRSPFFPRKTSERSRPLDSFEQELMKQFERMPAPDSKEKKYAERQDQDGHYHFYQPLWAVKNRCLNCHRTFPSSDLNPGSLLGIMHITISEPPAQKAVADYWAWLLVAAIVTAALSMLAFYIVIRLIIIRPLRHLREVSEAISRGDTSQRADLHTGDEFESLALAFNRTMRQILSTQEKFRTLNTELDQRVDQLAQVNVQLYEMNRVKSDFMATMSHELRTPLNSIIGFSDVLGAIASLDEKQKRYVENISKSGKTLLKMINDILDLAKIESGQVDVHPLSFCISQIISAQCDMAKPLVDRKNIDLECDVPEGLPSMHQDQSRLQQILNNLISNAIKFTPEAGRIKIQARRVLPNRPNHHDSAVSLVPMLELKVIDNGVGIAEEDQQLIFEKFRQGKSAMTEGDLIKREHSGSGLGLSIVKELCRLLEGTVSVESQFGLGSTFTVLLPWTLEERPRVESEMMAELQQFANTKIRNRPL